MGKQVLQVSLGTFLIVFLMNISLYAQQQPIKGTITDVKSGETLPGVNILVKGTSIGTSTDNDGNYSLDVSSKQDTLVVSYVGYATKEVPINGRTTVNIDLKSQALQGEEMVVVGYGTQQKKDLTGSVVSADLKQFQEAPNTNILQSLKGSLPGITIGQTTTAGAEPDIKIRGRSTLNGNQNPLIVLDGVIYRGRISDINPNDIKSVDVLKDPSSKAVYGAQAANGVIIVSTKQGKSAQVPAVHYSTYYATRTPAKKRRTLNREEYLTAARNTDWKNGYLAPKYVDLNPDWTIEGNTAFFPPLVKGFKDGTNFDWFGSLTNPGFTLDHSLSVSGSTGKTSYYISGGLTKQQGWVINDDYGRQTVRINLDTDVYDWLKIGANTFGSFSDFSGISPALTSLPPMSPLTTPRDSSGELTLNPLGTFLVNPYLQTTADNRDNRNNISGVFFASIDVPKIPGLNYRVNYSHNYRWSLYAVSDIYGAGSSGTASKSNSSTHDEAFDNILTYKKRFGPADSHGLTATAVVGFNTIDYEYTRAAGSDYANLNLSYNSLEQAVIQKISSNAWEEKYASQTGRISYDYKHKYLVNASLRRDGFSGFAKNNKTALFPSIGLGWVISQEVFLKNVSDIDNLKLRGSYGSNGNTTSRYSSLARIAAPEDSKYVFGDGGTTVGGQTVVSLANPNLKWERTNGINIGLDFAFFGYKISGNVDYYKSITKDLLWNYILPRLSGFGSIRSNIGEIENTGLEVALDFNPIQKKDFNWDFGINFSKNDNRINQLLGRDRNNDGKEDDLVSNGLFIGESIGSVYSYVIDGLYQIGDKDIPEGWEPGQQRLKDLNGDGIITPEGDRKIIGRTEPAYQFGIKNSLSYKDFTVNFFITSIQGGRDSYLGLNDPWADPNGSYATLTQAQSSNRFSDIDYWTPSNPDAIFRTPGRSTPVAATPYEDRSFIRLQDISLSYNLSNHILDRIGIGNLKVHISGKNLVTLTDWDGWDPETGQGVGISSSGLPVMKSLTLGLDVTF